MKTNNCPHYELLVQIDHVLHLLINFRDAYVKEFFEFDKPSKKKKTKKTKVKK